nr:hypothetical protein [Tanacetum cinerariifolium]
MNYESIVAGTQSNGFVDPKSSHDDGSKPSRDDGKKVVEDPRKDSECKDQEKEVNVNSTNNVNTADNELPFDLNMPALEDVSIFNFSSDDEDDGTVADMNNLDKTIQVSHILTTRIQKDHSLDQVIRDLQSTTQTRKMTANFEEHGFTLVDLPNRKRAIGTKWVFENKKDERGIVIRNKARLVAQGYTQEEGIDYDEVFVLVARIKAIRLFLAYASFKDFVVYQMDVKSAFLYEKIKKEVCVCQPPGFEDPNFSDRVYKIEKALYGLHQALRAWHKGDILLVQVYVDDIIFGSTKKKLCIAFERLIHEKFQISSMGELTFLLGLQVKQKEDGIFISQDKYVAEILKKFRSMIGLLMYLTSSRPDIMFVVYVCARYQVNLKVLHLYVVKRIFSERNRQWLQIPQQKLNMWPLQVVVDKCFGFRINYLIMGIINTVIIVKFAMACVFLVFVAKKSVRLMMFCSTAMAKTINGEAHIHARVDGKEIVITESSVRRDLQLADEEGIDCLLNFTIFKHLALIGKPKRKDTQVPQPSGPTESVTDKAVHKELGDSLVRAATTAYSLKAKQDSGGGPRRQETMRDTIAQTRVLDLEQTKTTQKNETDSLKRRVKKLEKRNRSRTHKQKRLYKFGLIVMVESSSDEESLGEDASKQEKRINDIDADKDITLVNDADNEMFDVDDLGGEEVFVAGKNENAVEEVVNAA